MSWNYCLTNDGNQFKIVEAHWTYLKGSREFDSIYEVNLLRKSYPNIDVLLNELNMILHDNIVLSQICNP